MSTRHPVGVALAVAALSALPAACSRFERPATDIDCTPGAGGPGRVTGGATAWRTVADGQETVRVEGTAEHEDGLAIVRVEVAGVSADADAFNFGEWSVELQVGALAGDGPDPVELPVTAIDSCDRSHEIAVASVVLRPPPSVGGVSVTVGYPDGEDHLPSTLSIPAAVRVSAEGDADGVKALLTTERGGFVGAAPEDASSLTLTLSAAQGGGAEAAAFVTTEGAEPGEALLTVTALERTGVARIRIAGPPLLTPAGGSLLAGGVQPVDVSTYGRLVSCEATPPAGVEVTYAGRLLGGVAPIDELDGRRATLIIVVDADAL